MRQPLALVYGDAAAAAQNYYLQQFGAASRLGVTLLANLYTTTGLEARSLNWLAASDAREVTQLSGFAAAGASDSMSLRWGSGMYNSGAFSFAGTQSHSSVATTGKPCIRFSESNPCYGFS